MWLGAAGLAGLVALTLALWPADEPAPSASVPSSPSLVQHEAASTEALKTSAPEGSAAEHAQALEPVVAESAPSRPAASDIPASPKIASEKRPRTAKLARAAKSRASAKPRATALDPDLAEMFAPRKTNGTRGRTARTRDAELDGLFPEKGAPELGVNDSPLGNLD
jgi:hypothetical protein